MAAEFKTLLDDIYRSMAEPSLWPDTLVKLSDYLGAIGGMIIYNAPPGGRNLMITGRLDEEKNGDISQIPCVESLDARDAPRAV
jgi:hypothetical protein